MPVRWWSVVACSSSSRCCVIPNRQRVMSQSTRSQQAGRSGAGRHTMRSRLRRGWPSLGLTPVRQCCGRRRLARDIRASSRLAIAFGHRLKRCTSRRWCASTRRPVRRSGRKNMAGLTTAAAFIRDRVRHRRGMTAASTMRHPRGRLGALMRRPAAPFGSRILKKHFTDAGPILAVRPRHWSSMAR